MTADSTAKRTMKRDAKPYNEEDCAVCSKA